MGTRRLSFWLGVAGVSILANVGLEIIAAKFPQVGLVRFVEFAHRGPGGAAE